MKLDKKKLKKLDSKIINSITPFSNISYKKKQEIEVFVGREKYLKTLTEALYNSVYSDRSYGVSISGPGGCGKSTLFGYIMQLITSEKIYDESYCQLKRNECEIITCFIDAPKGEPTTLRYFWTSIIDSLAEEQMEFLDIFAVKLIRKCMHVLWISNFKNEEVKNIAKILIPSFEESIKHHNLVDLIKVNKFFDFLINNEDILLKIKKLIMGGWRILQRYEISFGIVGKVGDFNQKRSFKIEKNYFDLLFDILNSDFEKCTTAQDTFKGAEGDLIQSDSDVINLFNWLTNTWEWIEEKPISFFVGVDNIGYLTVGIDNKESAYVPFVQTILQMRDSLKKFLFVLIGTNEDWRVFNEYINKHQDYRTQLRGFLINKVDLTRLTLNEVLEALRLIMSRFWSQAGMIHPSNSIYPFSKDFFTYLYEYHMHEYREILINLQKIWDYYKTNTKVVELTDHFYMIKFFRIILKENASSIHNTTSYQFSELYFSNLIEWEREIIKSCFENIQSRHVGSTQSDLVERKLAEAIRVLQERETPKKIDWVQKTPAISVETESGRRTRYPDVYIKLTRQEITDKIRTFEIQVKMYDKKRFVKLNEIESSIELLERAYTDALLFVITGAGLEEKAIEEINKKNLADRVLYFKALDEEQFQALAFLVYYEDITGRKPNVNVIKEILELLFEKTWDNLLDQIRNIGSFRAKRILGKIKEKQTATIEGFLEPTATISEAKSKTESVIESQITETISSETHDLTRQTSLQSAQKEPEPETGRIDKIIGELGLLEHNIILKNQYTRYEEHLDELRFIFECIDKRTGRYAGKATKDYLKKRVPAHLSDENVNELFLRLKNEDTKDEVPQNEKIFEYKGTSICLIETGKRFFQLIKKLK
ncbi:MAG: ATP-binding protein [Promethearchaeota archaeon]